MEIAIGIDVHKEKCAAFAKFAGKGEPRPRHEEFLEKFNERFRRFDSDYRGMTELADFLRDHSVHILIENSTKSQDVYWMLRGLGLEVTVAHATDLKHITESMNKNDDNDAAKLAGYMRRRLWGEIEFARCYIPMQEILLQRELCRYDLRLRSELTALKCQIRSHMLIRGWKLTRDYQNIVCVAALRELNAADIDIFKFDVAKARYLKQLVAETDRALRARMETNRMFDIIWSIPGFGILSASYMTCMIDDISRFRDGKSLAAWMGLTPKLDESADKPKNCGITRRGIPR
ncbi:MAG: transposase [Candidatus Methanomethylophilus sp.]|nr:transposase [Methanomethylophilus sp.]